MDAAPSLNRMLGRSQREALALATLARECAAAGVEQRVMHLRLSALPSSHNRLHHQRLLREALLPALEVWAKVQSVPEPGLAILSAGRRDLSFDQCMPMPVRWAARGQSGPDAMQTAPGSWQVKALSDQHAHMAFDADGVWPQVGDRVALGISHPCTTFDKWRWMAVIEDDGRISGAISTHF
mgnify:CR=1 FL=1